MPRPPKHMESFARSSSTETGPQSKVDIVLWSPFSVRFNGAMTGRDQS